MDTIQTRRLTLRPVAPDDLEPLCKLWADAKVMRFLPTGEPRTCEAVRAQLEVMLAHERAHGFGVWAITLNGEPDLIGYCGLMYLHAEPGGVSEETARSMREVELMYGLGQPFWGQGIASEAARAVLRHGFETLRLPRIVAAIHPDNAASRRILESLGLRQDASLNFYGDCPHFAIKREDLQG